MSLGGIIGQAPDLNEYLPKSGGTMTGPLVLSGNPSGNLEAASKQYVDSKTSDWKELSRVSQTYTITRIGEEAKNFNFTGLWGYTSYKIYMEWDIYANANNAQYQWSLVYFPTLVNQNVNFEVKSSPVSTSFTSQIVLNNYYENLQAQDGQVASKVFPLFNANNWYFYANGTANLNLYVEVENNPLSSHRSTCTITIYGKN